MYRRDLSSRLEANIGETPLVYGRILTVILCYSFWSIGSHKLYCAFEILLNRLELPMHFKKKK